MPFDAASSMLFHDINHGPLPRQAEQVCEAAGVSRTALRNRLATYRDLERVLQASIREAERASGDATFWGWAIVGASVVQIENALAELG